MLHKSFFHSSLCMMYSQPNTSPFLPFYFDIVIQYNSDTAMPLQWHKIENFIKNEPCAHPLGIIKSQNLTSVLKNVPLAASNFRKQLGNDASSILQGISLIKRLKNRLFRGNGCFLQALFAESCKIKM